MPRLTRKKSYWPWMLILLILISASIFWVMRLKKQNFSMTLDAPEPTLKAAQTIEKQKTVIDYSQLGQESVTNTMMEERKAELGIGQGIDMIAKPEESLKVGDTTVPMQEILDQIRLKEGDILEKNLDEDPMDGVETAIRKSGTYGIYVVQPGDNIWNIHFKFLQDYFNRKGISLAPSSDEPDANGFSSGVGKVLKFSENMVHIYNLKEKKLDANINLIRPLNKIIIYNMDQIFALLDQIDQTRVNRIQFDGETLWIPAD